MSMNQDDVGKAVREGYAGVARRGGPCCGSQQSCCCGGPAADTAGRSAGYSAEELAALPAGADLGLGCGNPVVLASPLPTALLDSVAGHVGCISGASLRDDYLGMISAAGFRAVTVVAEDRFPVEVTASDPTLQALVRESGLPVEELARLADGVRSIKVAAIRR